MSELLSTSGAAAKPAAWSLHRVARAVECVVLFGGLPLVLLPIIPERPGILIPFLVGTAIFALGLLLTDRTFDVRSLAGARAIVRDLPRMLLVFAGGAVAIAIFTWLYDPDRLFAFARGNPERYAFVMLAYPIFSVYPQEIIFRAFFFHRYATVFRSPAAMIAASGIAFGWGHVIFGWHWVPMTLSTIGGLLFAWTYQRTRSTLAASLEHALYGDFIWTIGLGWYFYSGAVRHFG